ncbi:hypothetical protein EST38_g7435 [Candolleomyces aberdarensis]|uniref:Uncharacterized protein n=1 Tax=Candolleomyces aberdarensis TaxID=2316362 RepID=A0A4Q2DGY5_9AGAR|nr:hypothetical protein EST38_g7435 [Candolleomyces aberdarensis]
MYSRDIRYMRWTFQEIGRQIGDPQWFSEDDFKTLVRAGSGHPAFTMIVYKYISEYPSPAERLKTILTWAPPEGQTGPLSEVLDWLYTNMLSAAKTAYEAADTHSGRDFLLLLRIYQLNFSNNLLSPGAIVPLDTLTSLLDLERDAARILAWDLRPLTLQDNTGVDLRRPMEWDSPNPVVVRRAMQPYGYVYCKPFVDYWNQESRAKELFVHFSRVCTHLPKCCMHHITQCPLEIDSHGWEELPLSEPRRSALLEAVKGLPSFLEGAAGIEGDIVDFSRRGGWDKFDKLLPLARQMDPTRCLNDWVKSLILVADRLEEHQAEVASVMSKFLEKWKGELDKETPLHSRLAYIVALTNSVGNNPGQGPVASKKDEQVRETRVFKLNSAAVGNDRKRGSATGEGGMGGAGPEGTVGITAPAEGNKPKKDEQVEEPQLSENLAQAARRPGETNRLLTMKQKLRSLALSICCCFRG